MSEFFNKYKEPIFMGTVAVSILVLGYYVYRLNKDVGVTNSTLLDLSRACVQTRENCKCSAPVFSPQKPAVSPKTVEEILDEELAQELLKTE